MTKTRKMELKVFRVEALCDYCGSALQFTGEVLASFPPQYKYTCGCGVNCALKDLYPRMEYETVTNSGE